MATADNVITSARYDLRAVRGSSFDPAELLVYLNRVVIVLDSVLLSMDSDWLHQTQVSAGLTAGLQKITMPTRCISIRSIWVTDIIDSFTDLTFTAAGDTIATAAGTFSTNGIAVNQTIGITGSTSNNTNDIGLLSVSAVTEILITVNENVIVNEGTADASGTIFAQKSDEVVKKSTDVIHEKRMQISGTGRPYYWAYEGTDLIFDHKANQAYGLFIRYNQKSAALEMNTPMPYNDEFNELLREGLVMYGKARRGELSSVDSVLRNMINNAVMTKAIRRDHIPKRYRADF
ncbi:hypothetical protein LCGC14_2981950 [marine sediment metagenome]|uniref:Uncharacterized protein n=1 Tax=marine sediment metagenome TaxID=412755 RepID=A0A0F8XTU5_9ZZZZ